MIESLAKRETMTDIADLLDGLKRAPGILSAFAGTIPEDKLHRCRGAGFWTIAEHLSHLAQVQPMMLERLQRFVAEDHPRFIPFIPGDDADATDTPKILDPDTALVQFSKGRKRQLELLESTSDTVWQKTATHPEYDRYSFHILVRHILMHDHWHMFRMEELWLTKDEYLTQLS